MRAAVQELDGEPTLEGRRVHVVGVGHVGAPLVGMLVDAGAVVSVSDVFADRVDAVVARHGVAVHAPDRALAVACDVLAPCALGGMLDDSSIPRLRCRAVVGAANNQLGSDRAAEQLAARDVLFVPDFVASAGGIINIAEEFVGYDRARALERAAGIEQTTSRVLRAARDRGVTPQRAAEDLARDRIAQEGAPRRWEPGDPAAWTNGAPLTRLRPTFP
jgi:glutamate dehydrogenase/leucine dehydrogenase